MRGILTDLYYKASPALITLLHLYEYMIQSKLDQRKIQRKLATQIYANPTYLVNMYSALQIMFNFNLLGEKCIKFEWLLDI